MSSSNRNMNKIMITDSHTLYVFTLNASLEEIYRSFRKSIDDYNKKYDENLESFIYVNLVISTVRVNFNYAYIFIENEELYHLFLKKEKDGSNPVKIPDPNFKRVNTFETFKYEPGVKIDWSEEVEEEVEEAPLIYKKNHREIENPTILWTWNNTAPVVTDLKINECKVADNSANSKISLICKNVDKSITVNDVFSICSKFVPKGLTKEITVNGQPRSVDIPFVFKKDDDIVVIFFENEINSNLPHIQKILHECPLKKFENNTIKSYKLSFSFMKKEFAQKKNKKAFPKKKAYKK